MQVSAITSHLVRLVSLAVLALATGCAATEGALKEKGAKPLAGSEIRSTFAGAGTMKWVNARNHSGTMVFAEPDKLDVAWGTGSATGTVRFTPDGHCSKYPTVRGGQEECYRVYRTGDKELTIFKADGSYDARISLSK
jgi:hypothetical protein